MVSLIAETSEKFPAAATFEEKFKKKKGRSPVRVRKCTLRFPFSEKYLLQL
jgi:hypothetical protein